MRIRAAVDARADADILIMARTDARAVTGLDDALDRCRDFVDEGADIIFLEAPESVEEMRRFCAEIPRPTMANMIDGGRTPILPPAELEALGYRLVAYPLVLLSAAIAAMNQALTGLRRDAATARPPELTFDALQAVVGFPAYWADEMRYKVD